jgi:hypothetical protein
MRAKQGMDQSTISGLTKTAKQLLLPLPAIPLLDAHLPTLYTGTT